MKKFKQLLALSTAALIALSLAACGSSSTDSSSSAESSDSTAEASGNDIFRTLDEIKESGTINIGVFSDKNPFGYVDENGEYQGYDIYFANRIGEDLGVDVNFVSTEAANRIEYLKTGKVDLILANFTVTPERAEEVDFALPYMNVALGVISPEDKVITSLDDWNPDDEMIVISGTTAEPYLTKNYPDMKLQKYDTYANAKNALENGNGAAWTNDNTEVIAFALQNKGYTVGISSLGSLDTIAPAVSKGNTTLLDWLNDEIKSLGEENFFHADYEATLTDTYGAEYEDTLVVEGGVVAGSDEDAAAVETADEPSADDADKEAAEENAAVDTEESSADAEAEETTANE
ncbi:MAG: transporter substrate-binding domain-containing protein [Lachnospiraceae bacterium]|nr:transporter substrate-binding domain-containing protein [Lachnospiraceae bacterium]